MIQNFLLLIIVVIVGICMFIVAYWKIILSIFVVVAIIIIATVYFSIKGESKKHTSQNEKNSLGQESSQCFLKTTAIRENCAYLMQDKYSHSQEAGYLHCALRKKECLCNNSSANICDSTQQNEKNLLEQGRSQCFLKTIAIRENCTYLMQDKYSCSQKGGYLHCVLKRKEGLCDNRSANICDITQSQMSETQKAYLWKKIKPCHFVERARNNGCDFFENKSEQCMLKNGYLGCRWRVASYGSYRPVTVRTYVKKNGTVVYSHGRSRKSR